MRYAALTQRLHGAGAAAWDIHVAAVEAQRAGKDVIFASVGDPDFATPAPITDRAVETMRAGDTHYSDIPGRPLLRAAIADHLRNRCAIPCGPENVIALGGAQNGLFAVSLCLFEGDDEVLLLEPAYVTYEATFSLTGATLVRVPMSGETGFRLDEERLRAAITSRTKGIVFANPNNPTGVVMRREELDAIARIAQEHDLWVVVDEVYSSLTFEHSHISLASLPGMAERTVTIGSLSKSHAMTGWRMGWACGPAELVSLLHRLALNMLYGLPGFIQEAAVTAFEHYDAVTEQMREAYRTRRAIVTSELAGVPGLKVLSPEAGMFVLLDVRALGTPPIDLAWALFHETGVSTLDATAFGAAAHGFLRVTFAISDAELREASRRIARFFSSRAAIGHNSVGV